MEDFLFIPKFQLDPEKNELGNITFLNISYSLGKIIYLANYNFFM